MDFVYNDGGRSLAGYKGHTGDCVVRAVSIATGQPYQTVYDLFNELSTEERRCRQRRSNSRTGVRRTTIKKYLLSLGWVWTATTTIGSGCKVHLKKDELPSGIVVCSVSRHITVVIDGTINDTYNPSRNETRCVYGYYTKP